MPNEATVAMLKKIAKKSKPGVYTEYSPQAVVFALSALDVGWKAELSEARVSLHGSGTSDVGDAIIGEILGDESLSVGGGYSKKEPFRVFTRGGVAPGLLAATVEKILVDKLKSGQTFEVLGVRIGGADKIYVKDGDVYVHGLTAVVPAWEITAPDGRSLKLPVLPVAKYKGGGAGHEIRPGNPHGFTGPTLFTWLYKEFPGLPEQADKAANTPEVKAAAERKAMLQMVSQHLGHFGTCPVCENIQKLFPEIKMDGHPTMVHHGYERPGDGYIYDDCFAVKMPPYELSSIGCQKFADYLRDVKIPRAEKSLADAKAATSLTGYFARVPKYTKAEKYDNLTLHLDGTVTDNGKSMTAEEAAVMGPFFHPGRLDPDADVASYVADVLKAEVERCGRELHRLVQTKDYMLKKVAEWKPAPLPGLSKEDQEELAASRAAYCPGSGAHDHGNEGRGRMSPWAKCKHCGKRVSITSTGKMRNHMKVGAK